MKPQRIEPQQPARLLDGMEYHNAASHTSSDGLRERFKNVNPQWNRKPVKELRPDHQIPLHDGICPECEIETEGL